MGSQPLHVNRTSNRNLAKSLITFIRRNCLCLSTCPRTRLSTLPLILNHDTHHHSLKSTLDCRTPTTNSRSENLLPFSHNPNFYQTNSYSGLWGIALQCRSGEPHDSLPSALLFSLLEVSRLSNRQDNQYQTYFFYLSQRSNSSLDLCFLLFR